LICVLFVCSQCKTLQEDLDVFDLLADIIEVEIQDTTVFQQRKTDKLGDYIVEECIEATNNMTLNYFDYPYYLINSYSWRDIDDLGNYYACTKELAGIAQYYSLNINITNIPFNFRSGM